MRPPHLFLTKSFLQKSLVEELAEKWLFCTNVTHGHVTATCGPSVTLEPTTMWRICRFAPKQPLLTTFLWLRSWIRHLGGWEDGLGRHLVPPPLHVRDLLFCLILLNYMTSGVFSGCKLSLSKQHISFYLNAAILGWLLAAVQLKKQHPRHKYNLSIFKAKWFNTYLQNYKNGQRWWWCAAHHDGMYVSNRKLPFCVYSVDNTGSTQSLLSVFFNSNRCDSLNWVFQKSECSFFLFKKHKWDNKISVTTKFSHEKEYTWTVAILFSSFCPEKMGKI